MKAGRSTRRSAARRPTTPPRLHRRLHHVTVRPRADRLATLLSDRALRQLTWQPNTKNLRTELATFEGEDAHLRPPEDRGCDARLAARVERSAGRMVDHVRPVQEDAVRIPRRFQS